MVKATKSDKNLSQSVPRASGRNRAAGKCIKAVSSRTTLPELAEFSRKVYDTISPEEWGRVLAVGDGVLHYATDGPDADKISMLREFGGGTASSAQATPEVSLVSYVLENTGNCHTIAVYADARSNRPVNVYASYLVNAIAAPGDPRCAIRGDVILGTLYE
jgi:hypothetical protein